jgi:hypothetical protein
MREGVGENKNPQTGIPIVDLMVSIDCFTAGHEDRDKIIRIIKELFNHCTTMKRLLLKHHKVIITQLMAKFDKTCHIYTNKVNPFKGEDSKHSSLETVP